MITLRTFATAFISNSNQILLMKRSDERKFAPGIWAAVGGHLEPEELNTPRIACLREIQEETGLVEEDLSYLDLEYIILRRCNLEIRIQYVYFGSTDKIDVKQSEEGRLHWIDQSELFNREMTYTTKMTLRHYIENREKIDRTIVGTVAEHDGNPIMNWEYVDDWRGESLI